MAIRLGVFVTHPIQYFAPLWRALAAAPGLSVRVHFFSDQSVRGGLDRDFKVPVAWDTPLLAGYEHCFLSRNTDLSRPWSVSLPNAAGVLRDGQFDWVMIHGYTQRFEVQVVRAARALGIPVLQRGEVSDARATPAGWYRRVLKDLYLRWFYQHIERFCYIGENARRHLLRLRVGEDRMFFSPYSVDSDTFDRQREGLDHFSCRRQLGIGPAQTVVLFSGKFIPRKAPLLLLEAVSRLADRERVTLLMVGDGELRQAVEERARRLLGDRAILPGFVNQTKLGAYYRAADIFVLPSLFETWGLVVNEAMHFCLPVVVSSAVGCRPDLVHEGKTGLVFPAGSAEGLAGCLRALLDAPGRARAMGAAAGEHIRGYTTEASGAGIRKALGLDR
jgi:glycosyltransferase involved in cell wall biosynthesis